MENYFQFGLGPFLFNQQHSHIRSDIVLITFQADLIEHFMQYGLSAINFVSRGTRLTLFSVLMDVTKYSALPVLNHNFDFMDHISQVVQIICNFILAQHN